jgi:CMP-N,N'-diacetyllegionaminic acid synthase
MLIAIVPARGGSKGVPNKNLRRIGKSSLVQISVNFALACKEIDLVFLSTESDEIANEILPENKKMDFLNLKEGETIEISKRLKLHKRRKDQAGDKSRTIETVVDIIQGEKIDNDDWILLLQPTSPFRFETEISELLDLVKAKNIQSCASAKLFDSPHPAKAFKVDENFLLDAGELDKLATPRQELESFYVFDGAFYLAKVSSIMINNSLLSPLTGIFLRKGIRTLNIDTEEDMQFASSLSAMNLLN